MKMIVKICFVSFLLLTVYENVNCAMKKSWKSSANFDTEIPKFTPFENEGSLTINKETSLNEIVMKTTQTSTNLSPSAETLSSKISSRIKAPNQIADVYSQIYQDMHKTENDFGTFEGNKENDEQSSEAVQDILVHIQPEPENEQINIQQILNELSEEADKESAASDSSNNEDIADELEISSVTNDATNTTEFKVGPLMNVTIDSGDSLVNVNLDKNTLKEIFTGSSS